MQAIEKIAAGLNGPFLRILVERRTKKCVIPNGGRWSVLPPACRADHMYQRKYIYYMCVGPYMVIQNTIVQKGVRSLPRISNSIRRARVVRSSVNPHVNRNRSVDSSPARYFYPFIYVLFYIYTYIYFFVVFFNDSLANPLMCCRQRLFLFFSVHCSLYLSVCSYSTQSGRTEIGTNRPRDTREIEQACTKSTRLRVKSSRESIVSRDRRDRSGNTPVCVSVTCPIPSGFLPLVENLE